MRRPVKPAMLSTAFRAFYEQHRPGYFAYAAARLPDGEAHVAVAHTFALIAADWPTAVTRPSPAAYAWNLHTHYVTSRTGTSTSREQDTALMHDHLHLTIDRIATLTGTEPATVAARLATARRCAGRRHGTQDSVPSSARGPVPAGTTKCL
ncbi:hypothetical protein ABZ383_06755 [Streptomyces sp. NPDC005900]|uniref:hypothetical protein n=1 Tax=Streptomyces sp. NPDC005900 TaxID=3154569 RepID=UPI0033C121BD